MKRLSDHYLCLLVFLACVTVLSGKAWAQSADTASIVGTVTDSQGAVLPGVTVTAHHLGTGLSRGAVTVGNGSYRISALPPGPYELTAQLSGFQTLHREGISLTLNSENVINLQLQIAGVEEAITVTGDTPIVETTTAQVSATLVRDQIDLLPLVGRNVFDLVRLAPGAQNSNGVSFTGSRGRSNQFLIDGVDNSEDISGYNRQDFALDAIEEFQVLVNDFKAEYGSASGGVINVVSRSGTNTIRGNAFFLFRNQDMMAKSPFATEKDPFQRMNYGGTFGGPIVKGRTHFFVAYEREDRDTSTSATYVVPPANAPFSPATLEFLSTNGISPSLFGAGGSQRYVRPEYVDVHKFNVKVDHQISNTQMLTARYTLERDWEPSGTAGTIFDYNGSTALFRTQYGNVAHKWVMSPARLNEIYFQFGQTRGDWKATSPELINLNVASSSFLLGGPDNYPQGRTDYVYEVREALTWSRAESRTGEHTLKFGGNAKVFRSASFFDSNFRGTYSFPTLADFVAGRPSRFTQNQGDSTLDRPNVILGVYAQDDWRLRPSLTLNVGVRYDYEAAHTEALKDVSGEAGPGISGDKNNFSPRFGFNWAPGGSTKQVIYGGTGLYYDQIILNIIGNARFTPPKVIGVQVDNPPFPDPTAGGTARIPPPNVSIIDPDLRTGYNWNSVIGYRREITPDLGVDVSYVHNRGYDHVGIINTNAGTGANINGAGAVRPDPNFTNKSFYTNLGWIHYHGLLVELQKRFRHSWQGGVAYTLSKTRDNLFNFVSNIGVPERPELNEGPGSDDRRHRLTAHAELELPWEIQLGVIGEYGTEAPLSITAGTATSGRDLNGDGITGDWVNESICRNISCPGFNYSRNSVRELSTAEANRLRALFGLSPIREYANNPKLRNVHLTLQKRFRTAGSQRARLTVEVFNLFNWPQYNQPQQSITSNLFGQITNISDGATTARIRALQLTFQYDF